MIKTLKTCLWGRYISLPIEYECYDGEVITEKQTDLVKKLSENPEWIEKAKIMVEDYCRDKVKQDLDNQDKDNIFSYVRPISIYVKNGKKVRAGIVCDYRYNEDDGIAIVFYPNGTIRVGDQGLLA